MFYGELINGLIIVVLSGLVIKFVVDWRKKSVTAWQEFEITWTEFLVTTVLFLCLALPSFNGVFNYLAFQSQVTYKENWNGYETYAQWDRIVCHKDGVCTHCYDCDPYYVDYDCSYDTTENGKTVHHSKTCQEKKYHECPYTTEEWTFVVHTTIGNFTIAAHNLPTDPNAHRWDRFERVPDYIPSGIPAYWQAAHDRLEVNEPGPVTARNDYANYVLASSNTILQKSAGDVTKYKTAGLLPNLDPSVDGAFMENRVFFVGTHPQGDWFKSSNFFNGAFGLELQGDLYLVIVDANTVTDPDAYTGALAAYWQSAVFAKDALSKNGLVVVLGTKDGKTVTWSRGATGMPSGNEQLLLDLRDKLAGTSLEPASIFGSPTGTVTQSGTELTVQIHHTQGALEQILWGPDKFSRVHMQKYQYLSHDIKPTGEQLVWLYVFVFFASLAAWGTCVKCGPDTWHRLRPHFRRFG